MSENAIDDPGVGRSLTAAVNPAISAEEQTLLVEAIEAARIKYPEFSILEPLMSTIGAALLLPNWERIHVDEYIDCLVAVARYANFCADVRDKLREAAAANPSERAATGEQDCMLGDRPISREQLQGHVTTLAEATAALRRLHPDLEDFRSAMDVVAAGLKPNLNVITPAIFLEYLYTIVKYSDSTAGLREELLQRAAPEGGAYRM
jgi:hypothetical protein